MEGGDEYTDDYTLSEYAESYYHTGGCIDTYSSDPDLYPDEYDDEHDNYWDDC